MNNVNYLQKISITKMYRTIRVPAYEFKFNLVVYPLQGTSNNVSKVEQIRFLLNYQSHRVTANSMF